MIIWGSRGVTGTTGRGTFYCPGCNGEGEYAAKRIRRFFTLYFIPIIPMGTVAEFIECVRCKGQFRKEVLDHDPRKLAVAAEEHFRDAVVEVMIRGAALAAGGREPGKWLGPLTQALRESTGRELAPADVAARLRRVSAQDISWRTRLGMTGESINEAGKEHLFRAALWSLSIASDGRADGASDAFLEQVAGTLRMAPAHVRGILAELANDGGESDAGSR